MKQIIILLFIFLTINFTSLTQELKSVKGWFNRNVFVKGKIYMVNEKQPYAEAVVVNSQFAT